MGPTVLIVGLTSSTATVGVAVASDGRMLASRQASTDRRHAEEITPMLVEVVREAGVQLGQVSRLAVDIGPGRFTGLRVGLATARALALAVERPVVGISSLELLSAAVEDRPVAAVIDARRNEVFQQLIEADGSTTGPAVGPPAELAALLPPGTVIVGDGADRYASIYGPGVMLGAEPAAEVLVSMAAERPAVPGAQVRPLYLRQPDVQINIKTRDNTGVGSRPRSTS